jgi:hypothetical protein
MYILKCIKLYECYVKKGEVLPAMKAYGGVDV